MHVDGWVCSNETRYVRVTSSGGATGFSGGLDDIVGLEIHTNMTATGALTFGGNGIVSGTIFPPSGILIF
jgi:hypothetical protein